MIIQRLRKVHSPFQPLFREKITAGKETRVSLVYRLIPSSYDCKLWSLVLFGCAIENMVLRIGKNIQIILFQLPYSGTELVVLGMGKKLF